MEWGETLIIKKIMALGLPVLLAGCQTASYQGPYRLMGTNAGPAAIEQGYARPAPQAFLDDFKNARAARSDYAAAAPQAMIAQMMRSGFMYNYSFCSDYFRKMAIAQRNSKVMRRTLPALTTLITGGVGLLDFASHPGAKEKIVQGIALGSAFATSTLDIYDEQFLYGTDNIDSVEGMTLRAMDAHARQALGQQAVPFETAVMHLIDNQNICSPQSVLTLARSAIKAAVPKAEAKQPDGTAAPAVTPAKVQVSIE